MFLRGTFIVPSFDEIWPQPGKERAGKARTRMGYDYILEAMQVVLDVGWYIVVDSGESRPCRWF